ncbi:restriction endonuclease [Microcoleus sp. FACHB-68]|uniref:restriction endonuclease n=1 Tax=Microcoleus sp. FACHB-68 TaxID=2692826 RepID=UPI001688EC41|nr:restriction endonuclease [Microcoleus sp. FACHB-68]MBD1936262.1 restriction endonuclease [Microcoleus sp. FACHB-68]
MEIQPALPTYDNLFEPTIKALKALGGSGNVREIYEKVCEIQEFSEEQQSILYKEGPQTAIYARLSWTRLYLKNYGAIENSGRGFWSLTEKGRNLQVIDKREIKQVSQPRKSKDSIKLDEAQPDALIPVDSNLWTEKLLSILQKMPPDAFERLCQRILRASGFIKVQVTGKKGDGGIDGIGVLRISLLSFQVFFQCKRYSGSVGPAEIRDFRGAMVGRTDKGLFITTGTFTTEAKKEATRDGAPALDLIDGEQLSLILKDLKLGVETKTIEVVDIDENWFNHL